MHTLTLARQRGLVGWGDATSAAGEVNATFVQASQTSSAVTAIRSSVAVLDKVETAGEVFQPFTTLGTALAGDVDRGIHRPAQLR